MVLPRGIATSTVTATVQDTLAPLMDTCTTCGVSGPEDLKPTQDILVTTTTQTNLDSDGAKSMKILAHPMEVTHTTIGVPTTTATTVAKVSTCHLKDTLDTVVTTTSVMTTLTRSTTTREKGHECPSQLSISLIHRLRE